MLKYSSFKGITIVGIWFGILCLFYFNQSPQHAQKSPEKQSESTRYLKYSGSDSVTDAVRNAETGLYRVEVSGQSDRESLSKIGKIVGDYSRHVVLAVPTSGKNLATTLAYQEVETSVNLPGASFEPLRENPTGSMRLGAASRPNGSGYFTIQLASTAQDEWLNSLADVGVEVIQYVSHQAYLVYGDSNAIEKAADHSRVRWIGRYTAEQKVPSVVKEQVAGFSSKSAMRRGLSPLQVSSKGTVLVDVAVFSRAKVETFISEMNRANAGSFVRLNRLPNNFFNLVRCETTPDKIDDLAEFDDVFSITPVGERKIEDERSAQILAGNFTSVSSLTGPGYNPLNQFGVDGRNVTVSVADDGVGIPGDGGFYLTSTNVVDGPLRNALSGASGHGHLVGSIIAGATPYGNLDASGYNYGIGVAPRANIVNLPILKSGYSGTDAEAYDDSVLTPGPNGAHAFISNNSWGEGLNGNTYNSFTAQFDGFVRDASIGPGVDPICLIFSAGNEGANGLTQPKTAKNLIVVGNSENLRPELAGTNANNIDDLYVSSSRGPTVDGRIKPDVVAPGTGVTGGRSGGDAQSGNIDVNHRLGIGTSFAAPQITGMAALFANFWQNSAGTRLSPALIKAAIINSAQDINGNLTAAIAPNGQEGWGRPSLKRMFPGGGNLYINQEITLSSPSDNFGVFSGSVADSSKPIRVTLVWTDPPGASDPALVNNLDLEVNIGGTTYRGNVFSNGVSTTGGVSDSVNNVENVIIPAGIPSGTFYSVTVLPRALNGDGVLGNEDFTDQNYAVVASNYSGLPATGLFSVAGRVISPAGRGVPLARVQMVSMAGQVRETITNHFGYFNFKLVAGGQSHTISVSRKTYTFQNQIVSVNSNLTGLVFVATSGYP